MNNRRSFLQRALAIGAGALSLPTLAAAEPTQPRSSSQRSPDHHTDDDRAAGPPCLVVTPDIPKLPYTMDGGVKAFHLIAEPVKRELMPGRVIDAWGYNGVCPARRLKPITETGFASFSTTICRNRRLCTGTVWRFPSRWTECRTSVKSRSCLAAVSSTNSRSHQDGTFFYHSHGAMQEMIGMTGTFYPASPAGLYTARRSRFRPGVAGVGASAQ